MKTKNYANNTARPIVLWPLLSLSSWIGIFFLILSFLTINKVQAQDAGNFVQLNSQTEVNEFGMMGYTSVSGTLSIVNGANITDLSPLSSLTSVGDLSITNCDNLENLNGIQNNRR